MIIAEVMKMIIIFMLIIGVIPEHYIMPFVPLCEKLKMNFPPALWKHVKLFQILPPL